MKGFPRSGNRIVICDGNGGKTLPACRFDDLIRRQGTV